MKPQFNKSWLWISSIIIANILIFIYFSNKLGSYVSDNLIQNKEMLNSLK